MNTAHAILAATPRRTTKKATTATVAQRDLFERDLPPLQATVSQTFSGNVVVAMLGISAILCAVALFVIRKAEITV